MQAILELQKLETAQDDTVVMVVSTVSRNCV
jgi:hypothetical protein